MVPRETIGPYRLEALLGAGGMGEVFRAYDQRLDRRVAIKVVRPQGSPAWRERLRREARAAARLSHPAVVQIHDILEGEQGDSIVMELVEGETLAHRLHRGPLPVSEVVALGREIADGLAAAHHRGIVHRDLKAENVVVTPENHAKILDFGLAKELDPPAGESSLSTDGAVLGTLRAMSPEQARGQLVDPRSDLFSLGTLLYEAATGTSPFLGTSAAETLTQVCIRRQTPACELNPDVPAPLSDLIDRLLEKEPAHRPASADEVSRTLGRLADPGPGDSLPAAADEPTVGAAPAAVPGPTPKPMKPRGGRRLLAWAAAALLLVAVGAATALWWNAHRPPLRVAVLAPVVTAGREVAEADLLALGVRTALLQGLVDLRGLSALAPEQVDAVDGTPAARARAVAADEVLAAALSCRRASCRIEVRRIAGHDSEGRDGQLLQVAAFDVPTDDFGVLARVVAGHVRLSYPDHPPRAATADAVSSADAARLLRLRREFQTGGAALPPLLAGLAALRQSSPRFLDAWLLEAEVRLFRYQQVSKDAADLAQVYSLLATARALAPGNPEPVRRLALAALAGGEIERAGQALDDLERLDPGNVEGEVLRARLLERRGETAAALGRMQAAARRLPSWRVLYSLANMELRSGHTAAAQQVLHDLLERAPGQLDATSLLAQIELLHGSLEEAERLYGDLARRSPGVIELSNLATAQLLLGRYGAAEASFRRALALGPQNPIVTFGLADTLLLAGSQEEANALYDRVLALLGPEPGGGDPQLLTIAAQALAHRGRQQEAVDAALEALRRAPDNPQVRYEAALVYTLVGDLASAQLNAEQALSGGLGARWFDLPWFAPLRARPAFATRLRVGRPPP